MKLTVVALVAFVVVSVVLADKNQSRFRHKQSSKWSEFKAKHLGKHRHLLKDDVEEERRFANFERMEETIQEHNALVEAGEATFELGHNFLSVLDDHEKESLAGGIGVAVLAPENRDKRANNDYLTWVRTGKQLPASFDWRNEGWNPAVRQQGTCPSCWAFAAVAATEAQIFIATGKSIDLSEQYLVDCFSSSFGRGCQPNAPTYAMNYIIDNGIIAENTRPYKAQNGAWDACNVRFPLTTTQTSFGPRASITKQYAVRQGQNGLNAQYDGMDMLVNNGPMTICIYMGSQQFMQYSQGIYNNAADVGKTCNHIVNIVGYGSDGQDKDYWWIRNSWGPGWGIGGYMKMARNGVNYGNLLDYMSSPYMAASAGRSRLVG